MLTLARAIGAVMAGTVASGALGGLVGYLVGLLAPSFVTWLWNPTAAADPAFRATEFGLGLGVVSGLFLGAGASVFLAALFVVRETALARLKPGEHRHPLDG
jgi:membrane protein YqaA with SNARE-associated domain